ncbi:MAG: imidazole glycerol phosphate synthase subunit HisH [Gammaproteobacteria bacterium]|nr:MAG: imidazole glycerol phosphate synthase subunit HisH [Gammaproteobacteria bacterium]
MITAWVIAPVASALQQGGGCRGRGQPEPQAIQKPTGRIPGVGGIATVWRRFVASAVISYWIRCGNVDRKPVLAICVGMQALMSHSEENGGVACLDLLPGEVAFFATRNKAIEASGSKVPHMGWNGAAGDGSSPVARHQGPGTRFIFFTLPCGSDDSRYRGNLDYGLTGCAGIARRTVRNAVSSGEEPSRLTLLKIFSIGMVHACNTCH